MEKKTLRSIERSQDRIIGAIARLDAEFSRSAAKIKGRTGVRY
jgi:hypothetical protein